MANLGTMLSDLQLTGMGNLVNTDCTTLLNKCLREEVESWNWSFLFSNIVINSIIPYVTGTVTVTNGSSTVLGSGTTFTSNMNNWYLRVGATLTTPVIASFVNSTTLNLSTPWGGLSQSGLGFSFFPRFYDVSPLIEVYRVMQIDFLTSTSQEALNRIDPSRTSTGGNPSLRWAPAPWNQVTTLGDLQIELWPIPSNALPYLVEGKAGPIPLVNQTDLPQVPSNVLEAKAMMYLARSVFASNSNPKWAQLAEMYRTDYERELQIAKAADDRRKVTLGLTSGGAYKGGVNLGADYFATHDSAGPPYLGE